MLIVVSAGWCLDELDTLSFNKPPCLISFKGKPLLFHLFEKFHDAKFIVFSNYKRQILREYLKHFESDYLKDVDYTLVECEDISNISNVLNDALKDFDELEPAAFIDGGIYLPDDFELPPLISNYVGISPDIETHYSYINGLFTKTSSKMNSFTGLLLFKQMRMLKKILSEIRETSYEPEAGLCRALNLLQIDFTRLVIHKAAYFQSCLTLKDATDLEKDQTLLEDDDKPFISNESKSGNQLRFIGQLVIKLPMTPLAIKQSEFEKEWYKNLIEQNYEFVPEIYSYKILKMRTVHGKNLYGYKFAPTEIKRSLITRALVAISQLHELGNRDTKDNLATSKWFKDLFLMAESFKNLIPFANKESIYINGAYCANPLFARKKIERLLESYADTKEYLSHGEPSFQNIMFDAFLKKIVLISPRSFKRNEDDLSPYCDEVIDYACMYMSLKGNLDSFLDKNYSLRISHEGVNLNVLDSGFSEFENLFFMRSECKNENYIKLVHALLWLALMGEEQHDIDALFTSFYNACYYFDKAI